MGPLRIGEVAKRAGVGVETIRFYERRGLIADPPRASSGYRQYPPATVARIRFIRRAGELGFSLGEVAELLALRAAAAHGREVRRRAEAKLREIEGRMADLGRIRDQLAELATRCRRQATGAECPILESLETAAPSPTVQRG